MGSSGRGQWHQQYRHTYCLALSSSEACLIQLPHRPVELCFPHSYCPLCKFSLEIPTHRPSLFPGICQSIPLRRLIRKPPLESCVSAVVFLGMDLPLHNFCCRSNKTIADWKKKINRISCDRISQNIYI